MFLNLVTTKNVHQDPEFRVAPFSMSTCCYVTVIPWNDQLAVVIKKQRLFKIPVKICEIFETYREGFCVRLRIWLLTINITHVTDIECKNVENMAWSPTLKNVDGPGYR